MARPLQSPAPRLEAWYSQLSTRYVDLVGDYAGKERFFVEGDSLLLQVFSAPELDFEGISPNFYQKWKQSGGKYNCPRTHQPLGRT